MQCSLKLALVSYACNLEAKAGLVCIEFKATLIYIVTLSPKRHSFLFRCHLGISIFMSETILLQSWISFVGYGSLPQFSDHFYPIGWFFFFMKLESTLNYSKRRQ